MKLFTCELTPTGFENTYKALASHVLSQPLRNTGEWQSRDEKAASLTREAAVTIEYEVPYSLQDLQDEVMPNLPWAEDHFQERVSGIPHNPPPSSHYWPYQQSDNKDHRDSSGKFSHTYPERYWPPHDPAIYRGHNGNLNDVVDLLHRLPHTRQAFLPVWFPEDTGAVDHQRVPCSLGYQFLLREYKLNCFYFMRSCDLVRHFADDMYLTSRLTQMVADKIDAIPGKVTMVVSAMHTFRADDFVLGRELANGSDISRRMVNDHL